jgi:phosphoenolpyruvate synthase/pyruvate phosphate dikinase
LQAYTRLLAFSRALLAGMHAAAGILTSTGGMTSHAAVVARGWGKPCVCGCEGLSLDYKAKKCTVGSLELKEGDWVSINGTTGEVIKGQQVHLHVAELLGPCQPAQPLCCSPVPQNHVAFARSPPWQHC